MVMDGMGNSLTINGNSYTLPSDGWAVTPEGTSGSFTLCGLDPSCIDVVYNADGSYTYENSWSISDAAGNVLVSGADNGDSNCPVFGCTDSSACNYNDAADTDDGTCTFAAENFDCDGNCTATVDCNGDCAGTAEDLGCGCNEPAAAANADCDGNCLEGYAQVSETDYSLSNASGGCTDGSYTGS